MIEKLRQLEKEGLITLRPNNSGKLLIANYTPKVQYDKLWTEDLLQCRGLIVDLEGNVKARPFKKFFNIEELSTEEIPTTGFTAYDKMDGSLGILYKDEEDGKLKIATRGSFNSEQALKATEMLQEKYADFMFAPSFTYLFEILYPQNRIVCNYGSDERLVLLAIIDTETGEEVDVQDSRFPDKVESFDGIKDISQIKDFEDDTKEGFVLRFANGFRVKAKFAEYVRLHRIITQVNSKTVWEYLKEGKSFEELLERVPDEFYTWLKKTASELQEQYDTIRQEAREVFWKNVTLSGDSTKDCRKAFAVLANKEKYPSLQYKIFDGRSTDQDIWKILKPKYEKPFKIEI